jgi:serine/threonine protein kinase
MVPPDSPDLIDSAKAVCAQEGLQLLERLGEGSFKQVFLVRSSSGTNYALKIIRDPTPSPRTAREIESLLRCEHPSIARLIRHGTATVQGIQSEFVIEEHLAGGSMTARSGSTDISIEQAHEMGRHLIDALRHLRSLELVHRDIKPDNIMFREDMITPVLVDFGTVRDLSATSLTDTWLLRGPGTPYFASPEQLTNQKLLIDWRSDQFSLGVTLFYVVSRVHPYQLPDEPVFAQATVERVAQHGGFSDAFRHAVQGTALAPLARMVAPWPVQRYNTPQLLQADWS